MRETAATPTAAAGPGEGRSPERPRRLGHVAIALLLLVKVGLLLVLGPRVANDTGGYVAFADVIRGGSDWIHDAGLTHDCFPVSAFRTIGYPAAIAAAKWASGSAWMWSLCLFQVVLSVVATVALFRLAMRLTSSGVLAAAAALTHAAGSAIVYDATLLADSLHASLLIVMICRLGSAALDDRGMGTWDTVGCGLLLAASMILRDATLFLAPAFLPLALAAVWSGNAPRAGRIVKGVVLLALPLVLTTIGYTQWNRYRTGRAFITTSAQTAGLVPLFDAAWRGCPVFDGSSLLDLEVRANAVRFRWPEELVVNRVLFERHNLDAPSIAAAVTDKFLDTWRAHPRVMARAAALRLRPVPDHMIGVTDAVDELRRWASESSATASAHADGAPVAPLRVSVVQQGLSVVSRCLALLFLLGVPLEATAALLRPSRRSKRTAVHVGLWGICVAFPAFYALNHIEYRYLLPVMPVASLTSIAVAHRSYRWIAARFASPAPT